jgi:hypothetical protein
MAGDGRLERYRLNAGRCLELAQTFTDPESKRSLLGMANAWLTLAEQHLKNSETTLVYETPPPRNEPPPPVDEPPKPPPANESPKPPPVNDSPPAKESPPLHLNAAKPDEPKQC